MNCYIKCSKFPPLADARLQSLAVVFHGVANGSSKADRIN